MAEYLAIVRLLGAKTPNKLFFKAADSYGDALAGMVKEAGVSATSAFEEFEILKVTENGNAYTPVAARLQKRERGNVATLVRPSKKEEPRDAGPNTVPDRCCSVTVPEEETYISYTVAEG